MCKSRFTTYESYTLLRVQILNHLKVYCMNMKEKWTEVRKISFGRYLHTSKNIGDNRVVHIGGAGNHPMEIWDIDSNGKFTSNYGKMYKSNARYTGDEEMLRRTSGNYRSHSLIYLMTNN